MSIERTLAGLSARPLILSEPGRTEAIANKSDARATAQLEELIRNHHSFVWRTAQRMGVSPTDVDDVVQDVFIMAAAKLEQIRHERAFLFQSCVYVVGNLRRRAHRRREVLDEQRMHAEVDARSTPEQCAAQSEARAALQTILDAIPEELRAVFVLFELEGLTMAEIADLMDLPAGTVASRLRRAREIFRSQVEAADRGTR